MHSDKSYGEIVDVIGKEAASILMRDLPFSSKKRTGFWKPRMLYVPKRLGHGVWARRLIQSIGNDAASKLVAACPGEILNPSMPIAAYIEFRSQSIRTQHKQGVSIKWLAFLFDMTPRQIRNIVNG